MVQKHAGSLRRIVFRIAILPVLAGLAVAAHATLPLTPPEEFLEMEAVSAHAQEVLFLLGYSLQPVCVEKNGGWSAGVSPAIVFLKQPGGSASGKRAGILQQTFGAKPGQAVFLNDQPLTAYGIAGIHAGDIVDTMLIRPKPGDAQTDAAGEERTNPNPEPQPAAKPEGSLLEQIRAFNKMLDERAERIYSKDPVRKMTVLRNGTAIPVAVRMVRTCKMTLTAVDSKYSYADSDNREVIITKPMLQSLSHAELVVVLAHEAAHVALGLSKDRVSGKLVGKLVFGKLAGIGENVETETSAPKDADLIQADKLAMRVATGLGVEPAVYAATLKKLVAAEESWGRPDYARTRPMNPSRLEAIEKSLRLWEETKRYYPPRQVPLEKVRDAYARASAVAKGPSPAFLAAPLPVQDEDRTGRPAVEPAPQPKHSRMVPEDTGFAHIDDINAVPVREEGKARYQHFLTLPVPRAFIVDETGGWRFWWRDADAMLKAVDYCQKPGRKCWLYAVDDRVVWHGDVEHRIARRDQLQERP